MSLPSPPSDLATRKPALVTLAADAVLHRFYAAAFDPIFFDMSDLGRFNAPDARYGVLYCAQTDAGALAETFLRTPGRRVIDPGLLATKGYARLSPGTELTLISMAGPGLAIVGATAEVTSSGPPYLMSQQWSAALKAHPVAADGIAYRSRHDNDQICYALFDTAAAIVKEINRTTDLDADWFWELAEPYEMGRTRS